MMRMLLKKKFLHSCIIFIVSALFIACLQLGCRNAPQKVVLPPTNLSTVDLQFGQQQVDQMMRDRGEMAICVQKSDIIYEWAARQFAGEAVGKRIYWSSASPACPDECLADSGLEEGRGTIRLREKYEVGPEKSKKISCETLWACAVFELYNISYTKEHLAIHDGAVAGRLDRQQYIFGTARVEFKALKKTEQFYRRIWQPWAENKGMATEESPWFVGLPDTYEEWIKQYSDPSSYPYSSYGSYYDDKITPYLKK